MSYRYTMTPNIDPTYCGECSTLIQESNYTLPADRKPCPLCGSLARNFSVQIQDTLTTRERMGLKQKRLGHKKPIYEYVSGDDLYRKTGQWNKLTRVIDRENNQYKEIITNPKNGEIIRHCEEPLTEHFGRGSAKQQSSKSGEDA